MAIWLCHTDEQLRDFCEALRSDLAQSGVFADAFDHFSAGKTGVLVSSGPDVAGFLATLISVRDLRVMVIIPSGTFLDIEEIRQWTAHGVVDVIFSDTPRNAAEAVLSRLNRWRQVEIVIESPLVQKNLVGHSENWLKAVTLLIEIAMYSDKFVLITGESGTGKELAARLIHSLDPKVRGRDMILVDCTTLIPSLSGSELFGHTEDAFTGASKARKGAFELADNSTLFLDEIGELPPDLQAGLLRVIQEKSFKKIGSNTWQKTQFRLVAATNRDLEAEVREGRFRQDLYHRISAWHCTMPSLRERGEDILPLAEHFLKVHASSNGPSGFDPLVRAVLKKKEYAGNVRELQNLVIRLIGRHVGSGDVSIGDLPYEDWPAIGALRKTEGRNLMEDALSALIDEGMGKREIEHITSSLMTKIAEERTGKASEAAKLLGVTPRAIQQQKKRAGDLSGRP